MSDKKSKIEEHKADFKEGALIQELYGITISIEEGKDLPAADIRGSSDPYLEFKLVCQDSKETKEGKTKTIKKTLNPKWDESFSFVFERAPELLTMACFDWERLGHPDLLGEATIDISQLFKRAKGTEYTTEEKKELFKLPVIDQWVDLQNKTGKARGQIKIKIVSAYVPQVVGHTGKHVALIHPESAFTHLLELTLVSGTKIPSRDTLSKCDPIVHVNFGLYGFKTRVQMDTSEPVWNTYIPTWLTKESLTQVLKFVVYDADHDRVHARASEGAKFVGVTFLRPSILGESKEETEFQLPLGKVDPQTDAELGALLAKLPTKLEKEVDLSNGALKFKARLLPKSQAMEKFYHNVIDTYDLNKDGKLSFEELIHLASTIGSKLSVDELQQVFVKSDKDKSGFLTHDELFHLFQDKVFQDEKLMSSLLIAMQYGDAGEALLNRGLFANDIELQAQLDDEKINNEGAQLQIQDRQSGLLVKENLPTYIKSAMRLCYRTGLGQGAMNRPRIKETLKHLSVKQGVKMDAPASVHKIPSFIELHKLNINEIQGDLKDFKTFNEFFYRRLKPGARIAAEPDNDAVAISPADARATVFHSIDEAKKLWIKGEGFSVHNLLGDWGKGGKADAFNGASLMIARLAPQDYHRWHFPVSGVPQKRSPIDGTYYTVNPIAIRKSVDVYTENKRVVCPIETKEFGLVLLIAVGATMVGSIGFECKCKGLPTGAFNCTDGACYEGKKVKKFDPHGFFAFGGSTVLLLFKPGSIEFDSDLLANTRKGLETLVKVGESIGKATGYKSTK